jgi:acetolactate synthase-1/2/3 large subunit
MAARNSANKFIWRVFLMSESVTSSHALLGVFAQAGIDRVFLVPGESYLGVLDALVDFPQIDTVTCRHEGGAGFMAVADGRLSGRPGVAMVSRGPGASHAAIAVHTAQQDAVPFILLIGQVAEKDLRREAFQEVDYQQMFGGIAKWVFECRHPTQLAETAAKAIRVATSGACGPVVIVLPEDIQQQAVAVEKFKQCRQMAVVPAASVMTKLGEQITAAKKPLILAGGCFERPGGRECLKAFAEHFQIPVVVTFRRQDLFENDHPLYAGSMGLANPDDQMALLAESDLVLALGTRLGDITTQNYRFPAYGRAAQTFVHCYPDSRVVGWDTEADFPLVADPIALANALMQSLPPANPPNREWLTAWHAFRTRYMTWPEQTAKDGVEFVQVVKAVMDHASEQTTICLDAGTFAAPVYRYAPFTKGRRLMSPLAGAMGYGTPAALACALRDPKREVICMVGDGGMLMTGQEMILAVERQLPIIFIVSSNRTYGSIRKHQEEHYPGRTSGTTLFNPDFVEMAKSFGMQGLRINQLDDVSAVIAQARSLKAPVLVDVNTSLKGVVKSAT